MDLANLLIFDVHVNFQYMASSNYQKTGSFRVGLKLLKISLISKVRKSGLYIDSRLFTLCSRFSL